MFPWLFLFAFTANVRAGGPGLALLAEVQVAGESIHLSDLLPSETPAEMREAARAILLGAAPPLGGSITLTGERIAQALPAATLGEILVPSQVLVHRSARLLFRDEVVAAIRASLDANQLPGAAALEPEDVHFSAPVKVAVADAQLEVRRIDFDAALKQARFLLASAADRHCLPFVVMAQLPNGENASGPIGALPASGWLGSRLSADRGATAFLVEPGKPASLRVSSGSMQMLLDVLPLERGGLHQTIRVKVRGSGKVLRGQVVAPGRLEAQF